MQAATISWDNPAGGDLLLSSNWQGGIAPGPGDVAVFSLGGNLSYLVPAGTGTLTYLEARFLLGTSVLDLNDNVLQLADGLNIAGLGSPASLTLSEGTIDAQGFESAQIGTDASSIGELALDSSTLVFQERVEIGKFGDGTLSVINGGTLTSQGGIGSGRITLGREIGSTGVLNVVGAGSTVTIEDNIGALVVGSSGDGSMNVSDGAVVAVTNGSIGSQAGASGEVLVTGGGSALDVLAPDNSTFSVGSSGTGSLTIQAGASGSANGTDIGNLAGGVGILTVTGAGSTYTDTGDLIVGEAGTGTLVVENGAQVNADQFIVGEEAGSVGTALIQNGGTVTATGSIATLIAPFDGADGTVTVDGTGSLLDSSGLSIGVGTGGRGRLNVTNGGGVLANNLRLGASATGDAAVVVDGQSSSLTLTNLLDIGVAGITTPALLTVSNGGSVTAAGAEMVNDGSGVTVTGTGSSLSLSGNIGGQALTPVAEGNLLISNGGQLSNQASQWGGLSTLVVEGPGSQWSNSGLLRLQSVELTVRDGGSVTAGSLQIDTTLAGTSARVTGAGSSLNANGGMFLGAGGDASLVIENGGALTTNGATLADSGADSGTLTVTGAGSTWTDAGNFSTVIGFDGSGVVNLLDGAVATLGDIDISAFTGSFGTLAADGLGSQLSANAIYVGGNSGSAGGTGQLDVRNGASVQTGTLLLYAGGELDIDGGSVTATNAGIGAGVLNFADGLLTIDGGALDTGSTLNLSNAAPGIGKPTLRLDNGASTELLSLDIGEAGDGVLEVLNGSLVSGGSSGQMSVRVGLSGGEGSVLVSGAGASLDAGSTFVLVGSSGTGDLTVADGGQVTAQSIRIAAGTNSTGSVVVDGPGASIVATDVAVGEAGAGGGTLTVRNGGNVSATNVIAGVTEFSSDGTIFVRGAGSSISSQSLLIGDLSDGAVTVSSGANLQSDTIQVGAQSNGTLLVQDAGTSATVNGLLAVGFSGNGLLEIRNGATVDASGGVIGFQGAGTGAVVLSDPGSALNVASNLQIGQFGTGDLSLEAASRMTVGGTLVSGSAGGFATLNMQGAGTGLDAASANLDNLTASLLTGASLAISLDATLGSGSMQVAGSDALLAVGSNLFMDAFTLDIGTGGIVDVGGTLQMNDQGGVINVNGGTLRAGDLSIVPATPPDLGVVNFGTGRIELGGDFTIGNDGLLGPNLSLGNQRALQVAGTSTIDTGNTLTIDGGEFSTGSLANNGVLNFVSGRFALTGDDLSIGTGGLFGDRVTVSGDQVIDVTNTATVDADARLLIADGSFGAGNTVNNGRIALDGFFSTLAGTALTNQGSLTGSGTVSAQLVNQVGGDIRVFAGDDLQFTAANNNNAGDIDLLGGTAEFTQDLANLAGGRITGGGTLITATLSNQGTIQLSANSNILGDVDNTGQVVVSGGATATFFDDVVHNGSEIRVSTGSTAVYFGAVSGAGPFTGTGLNFFEGTFSPGNSPGLVDIEGDLAFGTTGELIMELAGLLGGDEYDVLNVAGTVTLGGLLDVALLDGFSPEAGDSFELIQAVTIIGEFGSLELPQLQGLRWDLAYLRDSEGMDTVRLTAQVVPLPAAAWLFASSLGLLGWVRARRSR